MARDWVRIARMVEGYYPSAIGGAQYDDSLRAALVEFANGVFDEVSRMTPRWSLAYASYAFTAQNGTLTYPLPAAFSKPMYLYYIDGGGTLKLVTLADEAQDQLVSGIGTGAPVGAPLRYAIQGGNMVLYPSPDTNGPGTSPTGSYPMVLIYDSTLLPIVETTATVSATGTTVTVPSTGYLTDEGVATSGSSVSIRGAGSLAGGSVADTLVGAWSAFAGTTFTIAPAAITTVTSAQCFFNSTNWLISNFRKVVLMGVLKEVASSKDDDDGFQRWNSRFEAEKEALIAYNAERQMAIEQLAAAVAGQRRPEFRDLDIPSIFDIRGS